MSESHPENDATLTVPSLDRSASSIRSINNLLNRSSSLDSDKILCRSNSNLIQSSQVDDEAGVIESKTGRPAIATVLHKEFEALKFGEDELLAFVSGEDDWEGWGTWLGGRRDIRQQRHHLRSRH